MSIRAASKSCPRFAGLGWFVAALIAAALVRFVFVVGSGLPFESDEAIVGLMARHILYDGARPIFYYGQQYMGPLEAVTAAAFFAILGPSVEALRLAPLAWSIVFVAFSAAFARQAFGRVAFWATLAYLIFPPLFLLTWSVKARGGYAELLALGAILLWQTVHLADRDRPPGRWIAFGAVAGLALWTDPLVVVYLVPSALYLILHRRGKLAHWTSPAAVVAAILTSLPMLAVNYRDPGVTYHQLIGPAVRAPITVGQLVHNLSNAVRDSYPIVVGIYQGCSTRSIFFAARAESGIPVRPVQVAALAGALILGLLLAWSLWRTIRGRTTPADLLLWILGFTMVPFILTQQQADYVTEPRYLLPLYATIPLAATYWSKLWLYRRGIALVALAAVLAINARGVIRFQPDLAGPYLEGEAIHAAAPALTRFLLDRSVHTIYAEYWLSYPIAFQSSERIVTSIIDPRLRVGFNRYIPYVISAEADPSPAVLVLSDGTTDRALRTWLGRHNATYQAFRWGNLTLYDRITPTFRPVTDHP